MKVMTACMLLFSSVAPAVAQDHSQAKPDHLIRAPYITSTGATVDKPGESQSGGNTPLDHRIQKQDNRIDNGICNGC